MTWLPTAAIERCLMATAGSRERGQLAAALWFVMRLNREPSTYVCRVCGSAVEVPSLGTALSVRRLATEAGVSKSTMERVRLKVAQSRRDSSVGQCHAVYVWRWPQDFAGEHKSSGQQPGTDNKEHDRTGAPKAKQKSRASRSTATPSEMLPVYNELALRWMRQRYKAGIRTGIATDEDRQKRLPKWRDALWQCHRKFDASRERLEELVDWITSHEIWVTACQSPAKLLKKDAKNEQPYYDTIVNQMEGDRIRMVNRKRRSVEHQSDRESWSKQHRLRDPAEEARREQERAEAAKREREEARKERERIERERAPPERVKADIAKLKRTIKGGAT